MKATPQEAKEAWEKKSNIYGIPNHPYSEGFMDALDLFKAAYRKALEEQIVIYKQYSSPDHIDAFETAIELLETTTP